MHHDPQITHTFIGREYGWDRVSDADPALLRNNREAAMRVINNPDDFPNANFTLCAHTVAEIDAFFAQYPLVEQFA